MQPPSQSSARRRPLPPGRAGAGLPKPPALTGSFWHMGLRTPPASLQVGSRPMAAVSSFVFKQIRLFMSKALLDKQSSYSVSPKRGKSLFLKSP